MVYWAPFVRLEAVVSVLSIVYLIAAVLVALYGANALLLTALYLRHRADRPKQPPELEIWPAITVQLPIYNELYVVNRLIDAVAQLDYPRHQLQIQVLDDSTDETTRLAQARVAHHRARGLDIELVHRHDRKGFKAGALAQGLASARGEFIAIFDADFVPGLDFLKRTVPHLVADPHLGFVQTRWGYINPDYSALAHAQTIALDGHFVVEHLGRNRSGLMMNFNGTAGVWRRETIESAGGWQGDTLTEDVDLSFRAQLQSCPDEELSGRREARNHELRLLTERLRAEGLLATREEDAASLTRAVHRFLLRTPSALVAFQLEDLLGETVAFNVPGVPLERHASWSQPLSAFVEDLPGDPRVAARLPERAERER